MKKQLFTTIVAGVLVLAACGSDSSSDSADSSDSGNSVAVTEAVDAPGGAQGEAAAAAIASAKDQGIDLDENCVNELASQLSDEDAQAIADAGPDGNADVSDEGTAIGTQLLGCADNGQIVDAFIAELKTSGQEFDEQCVRDGLKDIDLAALAASEDGQSGTPEEVISAVYSCFDLGS